LEDAYHPASLEYGQWICHRTAEECVVPPEPAESGQTTGTIDLEAPEASELDRLRAENARLRAELVRVESTEGPQRSGGRLRSVAIFVLVALAATTFAGAMVGVWARRTVFNDQVFADRAAAIGADPAVQAALGTYLTNELMNIVDPQALFQQALPDRAQILAVPLTNAVRGFVDERVHAFLASENFTRLWAEVVAQGHTAMVRLLRGESQVISTQGDTLVINLIPVINAALARIGEISPELFGKKIDIPTITANDLPEVAREKVSQALGRELSPTFGVIEVQGAGDELAAAQDAVRLFDLLFYALVLLTVVFVPLALWLSTHRRRTLLQLVLAAGIATVIIRRLALGLQSETLAQVKVAANRDAAASIGQILFNPLLDATWVVLWGLVAIAVVAWLTGPYGAAVWFRGLISGLFASVTAMAGGVSSPPAAAPAIAWARDHRGMLQAAGVAVTALLLLVTDLSWFGTLLLAVVLGLYLVALARLPEASPTSTSGAGGPGPSVPAAPA
jgi:hypothetical protein